MLDVSSLKQGDIVTLRCGDILVVAAVEPSDIPLGGIWVAYIKPSESVTTSLEFISTTTILRYEIDGRILYERDDQHPYTIVSIVKQGDV